MYAPKFDDHDGLWDFQGIMTFRRLEEERLAKELKKKEKKTTKKKTNKVKK